MMRLDRTLIISRIELAIMDKSLTDGVGRE